MTILTVPYQSKMNNIRAKLLFVLFFLIAVFSVAEIVLSHNMFLDPTRAIPNVYMGLQIIILFALIPSISGTVFGVREPMVPLIITIVISTILYLVFGILIVARVFETSNAWLLIIVLIIKVILLMTLLTAIFRFIKNLVKMEEVEEVIDTKHDYAFRRFGKSYFSF